MNRGSSEKIVGLIEAHGPISVADYMALCLFDPDDGYYTTREPFGAAGDFITAPEISQMFGELVAVWLLSAWQAIGRPLPVTLAEIGPGRGTLMKDMVRTLGRLDAGTRARRRVRHDRDQPAADRSAEARRCGDTAARFDWHGTHRRRCPTQPLLIVGNELFDAIPIRQFVEDAGRGWSARSASTTAGDLRFVAGAGSLDPALLPPDAAQAHRTARSSSSRRPATR